MTKLSLTKNYAVCLLPSGRIKVMTITTDVEILPKPKDESALKARLKSFAGFVPCDGFGHVVAQLKKGKTYLIRRGLQTHVEFMD